MKITLTIYLAMVINIAPAQIAIISDKDGNSNVRSSGKTGDNIIDKLKNGTFIYCVETHGNWTSIVYTKNKKEVEGYVYKDRYIPITKYEKIPIVSSLSSKVTLKKNNIEIVVTSQKFDKAKHRLTFFNDYPDQLELIDNKKIWGTDGNIPATEYKYIEINFGQRKYTLPKIAFESLYEVSLGSTKANYDKANDILYIQSLNSDGAGSYEVVWKIEKGVYKERFVTSGF